MWCERCAAEIPAARRAWCAACEQQCDAWGRQHASDIIAHTFAGASVAMVFAIGVPLLGGSPLFGIVGVVVGCATFLTARELGQRRRRQQFLATALPRAYLPSRT